MPNNSQVRQYRFTVSVQLNYEWTIVFTYTTRRVALPPAVAAFNNWFDKHKNPDIHYRIDGYCEEESVYQDAHIPEVDDEPEPETRKERELRIRKLLNL